MASMKYMASYGKHFKTKLMFYHVKLLMPVS